MSVNGAPEGMLKEVISQVRQRPMNRNLPGVEASEMQVERETLNQRVNGWSKVPEEAERDKIQSTGSFGFRLALDQRISFRLEDLLSTRGRRCEAMMVILHNEDKEQRFKVLCNNLFSL